MSSNPVVLNFHGPLSWLAEELEGSVFYSDMANRQALYILPPS